MFELQILYQKEGTTKKQTAQQKFLNTLNDAFCNMKGALFNSNSKYNYYKRV